PGRSTKRKSTTLIPASRTCLMTSAGLPATSVPPSLRFGDLGRRRERENAKRRKRERDLDLETRSLYLLPQTARRSFAFSLFRAFAFSRPVRIAGPTDAVSWDIMPVYRYSDQGVAARRTG